MFAKIIGGAICGVIFMAIIFLLNSMTGIISESSPTAIIYIIGILCMFAYISGALFWRSKIKIKSKSSNEVEANASTFFMSIFKL